MRIDPFNEHNSSNFCFYHFNFGERARNCVQPFAWNAVSVSTSRTYAPRYSGNDSSGINSTSCELPLGKAKLLFINDPLSQVNFMIDSGSQVSLLPCQRALNHSSVTGVLRSANGSRIPDFEDVTLNVSLHLNQYFRWNFKKARVSTAIIGIDFLSNFGLLVDAKLEAVRDGMA